jgi:hypothetical protein
VAEDQGIDKSKLSRLSCGMIAVLGMPEATCLMQVFVSAFLAILFLQSGIDKIVDRRGNFEWLKGHFAKSPLA